MKFTLKVVYAKTLESKVSFSLYETPTRPIKVEFGQLIQLFKFDFGN